MSRLIGTGCVEELGKPPRWQAYGKTIPCLGSVATTKEAVNDGNFTKKSYYFVKTPVLARILQVYLVGADADAMRMQCAAMRYTATNRQPRGAGLTGWSCCQSYGGVR